MFTHDFDSIDRTVIHCGMDEVGRGPVAGPLVVAGVANLTGWHSVELKDSKEFSSEKKLYRVAQDVQANTKWVIHPTPVGHINAAGIEKCLINSFRVVVKNLAMECMAAGIAEPHLKLIVDGNDIPDSDQIWRIMPGLSPRITITCIPRADADYPNVSAASIIAKAWRDGYMRKLVERQPELARYQLDRNKGYGTRGHASALIRHGLTPHHRIQFSRSLIKTYSDKFASEQASLSFTDDFSFQPGATT